MAKKDIKQLNQTYERLVEILDDIDQTYEKTKTEANKVESLNTTLSDLSDTVGEQGITIGGYESRITNLENIAAEYSLQYQDDYLSLIKDQKGVTQVVGSPIKIVSATETISSVITITRISAASDTVTLKEPGKITYKVESLQDGVETGSLDVTWKINGVTVLYETVEQGENTFDLAGRISTGNNGVTATFVDKIGTSYTTRWSIDVIDMYLTSTFNDTVPYNTAANVTFTAYGSIKKNIYILLDNELVHEMEVSTSGVQSLYTVPYQTHGAHSLEIYCKATMNTGREITSNHLYFDLIFIDENNDTPIIRWPYSGDNLSQYSPTTFKYSIYTPNQLTSDATLWVNGEQISEVNVNRNEQKWVYKPQFAGDDIVFMIRTGEVSKIKTLSITPIPYDVSPVDGVAIDFNPTGRSNNDSNYQEWTDGTYSMSVSEGFDWNNGGWKVDDQGDSYFCVKAGSSMTINYPLFESAQDVKQTGKNFKFIFKTTNNKQIKDTVISCLASGTTIDEVTGETKTNYVGLDLGTQEATVHAQTAQLEVQYVEDEKLELEFNISPAGDRQNMMLGYINTDPVKVSLYSASASFNQTALSGSWQPITIGSESCDVHLYRFKAYNTFLSDKDIMQNYIADATNSTEMISRYENNDILDDAGEEISYTKLAAKYPDLRILLITCPRFTFDKDDKVKGCTVQHMMGTSNSGVHNWTAENVQIKGQGTSSNEYGTSARNIDIKLNKLKDAEGNELDYALTYVQPGANGSSEVVKAKKYAMTDNSIAVNYFNIKVNVASSENANNARLAERFFQFNPYVRQARIDNPKVRDTMEFHPCVIFLKELGTDKEYGNQEFEADGRFHFYACGDFGNSKKNHEAFGMDLATYEDYDAAAKEQNSATPVDEEGQPLAKPTECIIEISNNTAAGCRFKVAEGWSEILPDSATTTNDKGEEVEIDVWGGDVVEFRYPEDLFDIIENEDKEFTDAQVGAANNVFVHLKQQVRRLWNWVASTDTTTATNEPIAQASWDTEYKYTTDSAEYRGAKFKNEYLQYLEPKSLLYNYLFTDRYLMIDNRAKNVFIHTVDGLIWDFCFDYDNDTSLGCDNRGTLKYEYYYEDTDKFGTEDVYNAADSVLWTNVRLFLKNELKQTYQDTKFYSAQGTIDDFNEYQSYKPERLQMFDMRRKYLRPYIEGHYGTNIKEGSKQSYQQYLPMLNGRKKYQRQAFEKYREPYTNSKYEVVSDTNAFHFRALVSKEAASTTKLTITPYCWLYVQVDYDTTSTAPVRTAAGTPCVVDVPIDGLSDTNTHIYHPAWLQAVDGLDKLYIRNANFDAGVRLSKLILGSSEDGYSNHKVENHTISLKNAKLLEELNVCGWTMPDSWALDLSDNSNIKRLYTLNTNVNSVTFADGGLLEEAKLNAISTLYAMNLKNLKTFEMTSKANLIKARLENTPIVTSHEFLSQCVNLKTLRLIGIDWEVEKTTLLDSFLTMTGIDENNYEPSGLKSVVAGKVYAQEIKESALIKYNETWPNLKITYPENGIIAQHKITFNNYDGSEIYSFYADHGTTITDPYESIKDKVVKPADAQYTYTFAGWDPVVNTSLAVTSARVYTATYSTTTRLYSVTWKLRDETVVQEVAYGSAAVCPFTEDKFANWVDGTAYCVFTGWDSAFSYITEDLVINAVWERGYLPDTSVDTSTLSASQIYAIKESGNINSYFEGGERIQFRMGHNPSYKNINSKRLITEPIYFNGTTTITPTDEDGNTIRLLENNSSWTLMVEYKITASTGALVGCFNDNFGFGIGYMNSKSAWWGSGKGITSAKPTSRNRVVLQHIKGETGIKAFMAEPWSNTIISQEFDDFVERSTSSPLTFGGIRSPQGTESSLGTGYIYECQLWDGVLGDQECQELVKWTGETISFDVVAKNSYSLTPTGDSEVTNIDLFSSGVLHFTRAMSSSSGASRWDNTDLYSWMNSRLYNAIPISIRSLMLKPYIPMGNRTLVNGTLFINKIQTNLWIPSLSEICLGNYPLYANEGAKKPMYTTTWSTRKWPGAWPKTFLTAQPSDLIISTTIPTNPTEGQIWYDNSKYSIFFNKEWIAETGIGSSTGTGHRLFWLRTPYTSDTLNYGVLWQYNTLGQASGSNNNHIVVCMSM